MHKNCNNILFYILFPNTITKYISHLIGIQNKCTTQLNINDNMGFAKKLCTACPNINHIKNHKEKLDDFGGGKLKDIIINIYPLCSI